MSDKDQVNAADKLRDANIVLEPDARAFTTVALRADGSAYMVALAERHAYVSQFELNLTVPLDVRIHFETAKNLYLYAWFVYRFYPVAEQQALATLEFGLRTRLAMLHPAKYGPSSTWIPSLSKMLETARKDGLISNAGMRATERWAMQRARNRVSDDATRRLIESGAEFIEFDPDSAVPEPQDYSADALSIFIETLPAIRNALAHGSSMLHPTVLGAVLLDHKVLADKLAALERRVSHHDNSLAEVINAIRALMAQPKPGNRPIGFTADVTGKPAKR